MKQSRCHLCVETSAHHGPAKLGAGTALHHPTLAAAGGPASPRGHEVVCSATSCSGLWSIHPSIHPSVCVPVPLARPGRSPGAAVTYPASMLGGHLSPELFHQLSLLLAHQTPS